MKFSRILFGMCILASGCSDSSKNSITATSPFKVSANATPTPSAQPIPSDNVTYDSIVQLIQSKNLTSIEALLPVLPEQFMRGYNLVYKSRSLQDASPLYPRAIVFGTTAKTIISFNGDSGQKGFNDLEVMEFDADKKSFNLHEINFPTLASPGQVRFSDANPQKCLQCHGNPVRPIWDNYPIWPGVYGVKHSIIGGSKDDTNFRAFIANTVTTSNRYSNLSNIGTVLPYDANPTDAAAYRSVNSLPASQEYQMKTPNTGTSGDQLSGLNFSLFWYNYQRVFKDLKHSPNYDHFKYALLAAVDRCGISEPITDFLPDRINAQMHDSGRAYSAIQSESSARAESYLLARHQRLASWDPLQPDPYYAPDQWKYDIGDGILPARYVLMSQGLDIHDWPMTLEFSDDLGTDQGQVWNMTTSLYQDIVVEMPELSAYADITPAIDFGSGPIAKEVLSKSSLRPQYCALLKQKSLAALANSILPIFTPGNSNASRVSTVLARCVACHIGENPMGPAIPFDQPDQLKEIINQGTPPLLEKIRKRLRANDSSRMPLGPTLPNDDILTLENYFLSISAP